MVTAGPELPEDVARVAEGSSVPWTASVARPSPPREPAADADDARGRGGSLRSAMASTPAPMGHDPAPRHERVRREVPGLHLLRVPQVGRDLAGAALLALDVGHRAGEIERRGSAMASLSTGARVDDLGFGRPRGLGGRQALEPRRARRSATRCAGRCGANSRARWAAAAITASSSGGWARGGVGSSCSRRSTRPRSRAAREHQLGTDDAARSRGGRPRGRGGSWRG